MNQCVKCDSSCVSCENIATNCTECPRGSFSSNGYCVKACPIQTIPLDGICQACDVSCNGCVERCDQCVNCAPGYLKYGSKCFKNCPETQYLDVSILTCRPCFEKCKTCSSVNFCTSCINPRSTPVNGLCYDCAYPCRECGQDVSRCTSCVTGFSLVGTTCISSCPQGANSINGVCICNSGFLSSNQCVRNCPTGYSNFNSACVKCD